MIPALLMILVCLVLAYILSELCKRIGLPRVVGQIVSGIILGIGIFRPVMFSPENLSVLKFLADLGIILLFYYIGLQMSMSTIKKYAKESVAVSLFKGIIPLIIGFLVSKYLLKLDDISSIVVAVSLSAGAQSVSVDLLEEMKMLKTKIGTLIISAGIITDILELIILGVLFAFFKVAIKHATLLQFAMHFIIFLLFIIAARIWLVPFIFKLFDREKSSTSRFMGSMVILLLIVSISEFLGIGALIGAFAAGVIIRQTIFKDVTIPTWEEHDIARSVHIFAFGFLIPLFFVWIGVNTEISALTTQPYLLIALILIAVISVVGATILAVKLVKGTFKEGMILGWGLSPKGDIGFIVGALALEAGVITQGLFSVLILMALTVTIVSQVTFKRLILHWKKHISRPSY